MAWRYLIGKIRARGSLRGLARWLYLATLVAGPWLYGATTATTIVLVTDSLGVALLLWIASHLVDRTRPRFPLPLLITAAVILLQGWWMTLNALAIYDSGFQSFTRIVPLLAGAPGSVDYVLSLAFMQRVTVLVGSVLLVAEMAQRSLWLLRLWYAIGLSGASIALLGLAQKGTGARMIFWQPRTTPADFNTFFATYYYHANAGAFLNLVLPAVGGLAAWMIARRSLAGRAVWGAALLIIVLASVANTSRMAQVIGVIILGAMMIAVLRGRERLVGGMEKRTMVIGLAVVVVTVFAVAQASRLEQPLERWQSMPEQLGNNARWLANRAALAAIPEAKVLGFGPGTFRAVFPHYQQGLPELKGTWRFLHDDYLHTILEWGWLGSAAMAVLFFGGIVTAARNYFKAESWSNRQRIFLSSIILALAGVAVHAVVDFPLQILSIQVLVVTYLGVCWGSGMWESRK